MKGRGSGSLETLGGEARQHSPTVLPFAQPSHRWGEEEGGSVGTSGREMIRAAAGFVSPPRNPCGSHWGAREPCNPRRWLETSAPRESHQHRHLTKMLAFLGLDGAFWSLYEEAETSRPTTSHQKRTPIRTGGWRRGEPQRGENACGRLGGLWGEGGADSLSSSLGTRCLAGSREARRGSLVSRWKKGGNSFNPEPGASLKVWGKMGFGSLRLYRTRPPSQHAHRHSLGS